MDEKATKSPNVKYKWSDLKRFGCDAMILEAASVIFKLRKKSADKGDTESIRAKAEAARHFRRCLSKSSKKLELIKLFRKHRLNQIEKELLLLIVLSHLGFDYPLSPFSNIRTALVNKFSDSISLTKAIHPRARLRKKRLLFGSTDNSGGNLWVASSIISSIVNSNSKIAGIRICSWNDFLETLDALVNHLNDRWNIYINRLHSIPRDQLEASTMLIRTALDEIRQMIRQHSEWQIHELLDFRSKDMLILLTLIAKELDLGESDTRWNGYQLSAAVSERVYEIPRNLSLLKHNYMLRKQSYIQVIGKFDGCGQTFEDDETIKKCEFEITPQFAKRLNLKKQQKMSKCVRQPVISMSQLVVPEKVKSAISLSLAQIKHSKQLFEQWGLSKSIPYGNAVVMCFFGSPGTGKTACAEAIAHELKRPLLVVNYAELQSMWSGETEKNISKTFSDAKKNNAVLFWDEADSVFCDRDNAVRNWEVRQINVLLQELERFNGVCILATNRRLAMDKALDRRISVKIEFERPDKELRKQLWKCMIPTEMPIAKDVDMDKLAEEDFSGGEIKNAVLNAARLALQRGEKATVTALDFNQALKLEKEGMRQEGTKFYGFAKRA